jgi:hypothetical protein
MRRSLAWIITGLLLVGMTAMAGSKKSRKPPKPLNKEVKYEAYKGTDVAQFVYKTTRKEFRVGHSPYRVVRFHVAEFVLISEHINKYVRPDYKAEIKMAPGRSKPTLMANKTFQGRWKDLLKAHKKLVAQVKNMRIPKECNVARAEFLAAMEDELFVAEKVAARMFDGQDTRSRERLKEALRKRFRSRNTDWFDRLTDEFESGADLSKFYPAFVDLLIKPRLDKAEEIAKRAMGKVGVEYATAEEEEGDITAP